MPLPDRSALKAIVENYRRIEARLRAIKKELEALPKTPSLADLLLNNDASLESAAQSLKAAEAALEKERGEEERISA
jgi:hypothetical protein